jgi:hypothetical protein
MRTSLSHSWHVCRRQCCYGYPQCGVWLSSCLEKNVKILTCGWLGNEQNGRSREWMYMWFFPLALNLGANALNPWITVSTPDYDTTTSPKVWDLMLFYATRPRIGWVVLSSLSGYQAKVGKYGPWTSAGRQAARAEGFLFVIGTYYMRRTAHFAALHGYYLAHHTEFDQGLNIRLMIAGALLYLIFAFYTLAILVWHGLFFDANLQWIEEDLGESQQNPTNGRGFHFDAYTSVPFVLGYVT